MKTLIKSLALALSLAVVTSAATFAETNPGGSPKVAASFKTGVYSSVNGKLNIALDKQVGGSVDIQLKNSTGDLLYTQHLGKKEATFRTRLNLDELADGAYVLEITNGVETTRQTITLKTKYPTTVIRVIQTESVAAK